MRAPRLLGITCGGEGLTERIDVALAAGVDVLVREPSLTDELLGWLQNGAIHGAGATRPRNAPGGVVGRIVLHDRMPGAREIAAAHGVGLHLRGSDDPARDDVRAARAQHGGLLGVSTHSPHEARAALLAGADYALLSPIWASPSKPTDARPPLGPDAFHGLRGLAVLALGGTTPERLVVARAAGAWGGAAMGALFHAEHGVLSREADPSSALTAWLDAANYSP